MTYFEGLKTVESIKAEYKRLSFANHPDLGGDTATMQTINREYEQALKRCDGQKSINEDGSTHTYKWNQETEEKVMQAIYSLISLNMENVEVCLIGVWIWITGDTKPHKEALKGIGCRWHSQRGCWYYKPYEGYTRHSKGSLSELAGKYGYEKVDLKKKRSKSKKIKSA